MNKLSHFGAVFSVLALFACSQDAVAPAEAAAQGESSGGRGGGGSDKSGNAPSVDDALGGDKPMSSCFGEPRPATGMCPAVVITNELGASPGHVVVHKGTAYVSSVVISR